MKCVLGREEDRRREREHSNTVTRHGGQLVVTYFIAISTNIYKSRNSTQRRN